VGPTEKRAIACGSGPTSARKSEAAFTRARTIADGIPLGQPILVGHHSERHHRRDVARIDSGMRAGVEHQAKAASMSSRAAEIDRQAEAAIYSDDPDAIEQLRSRIADLEARRERMKAINKTIRRGPGWEARIVPPLTEAERADLTSIAHAWAGVYKPGYPPYALQNLAGNITRQRKRLAELTARQAVRVALQADPRPATVAASRSPRRHLTPPTRIATARPRASAEITGRIPGPRHPRLRGRSC
jgi:hypothetical protein